MRFLHPQFRDENTSSRYPFTDSSTLIDSNGHSLANWLMDALIYPPDNVVALSLLSIYITGEEIVVSLGTAASNGTLCTGTVNLESTPDGTIPLVDNKGRPAGLLLADPNAIIGLRQYAIGTVTFPPGNADFVASVVVASPERGVRNFADKTNPPLANDVWLIGENGVQLTKTEEGYVRVDIVGEPLFVRENCAGDPAFQDNTYLRTINGIPGTYWGGYTLQVGRGDSTKPALRIYAADNVIYVGLALPAASV